MCPFNKPFYRSLRSHWDSAGEPAKPLIPGAQLSDIVRAFLFCCALCHKFERGSKNKGKLEQPVSSHCISNTLFHVAAVCLSFSGGFI